MEKITLTVEATVHAPAEKVWLSWTLPEHIKKWCNASEDWHAPHAENDLRTGGKFLTRMEAKDGSFGFDFGGVYNDVNTNKLISYTMDDGRTVKIIFEQQHNATKITESFEAETENPLELQQGGWQSILNNFKQYTESLA